MCFMNDFWNSTWQGVNVTNCYFVPSFVNVKVDSSNPNFVLMGNYKEDKMTIENSFFGGSALDMIPVDEETGKTTNTQGISDETVWMLSMQQAIGLTATRPCPERHLP